MTFKVDVRINYWICIIIYNFKIVIIKAIIIYFDTIITDIIFGRWILWGGQNPDF